MIHAEDILYRAGQVVAVLLFPITLPAIAFHYCTHIFPYEIPENSIYYPPWKRRDNQKMREQETLDALQKTYAYKYGRTASEIRAAYVASSTSASPCPP